MKRTFLIILLTPMLISGCISPNNIISGNDLFIIDHYSNEKIGIGMDKLDVEKQLGSFTYDESGKFHIYNDGIWIAYRDQNVAGIILKEGSEERFSTTRDLRIGSTRNEVIENYGDFIADEDLYDNTYMMFSILNHDGEFQVAPLLPENREQGYFFSINTGWNTENYDEVISISIIDYMYAIHVQ